MIIRRSKNGHVIAQLFTNSVLNKNRTHIIRKQIFFKTCATNTQKRVWKPFSGTNDSIGSSINVQSNSTLTGIPLALYERSIKRKTKRPLQMKRINLISLTKMIQWKFSQANQTIYEAWQNLYKETSICILCPRLNQLLIRKTRNPKELEKLEDLGKSKIEIISI